MKGRSVNSISPPAPQSWWREGWLFVLGLAAITLLAYQPIWRAGFLWDDDSYVTRNPLVQQAGGWWRIWAQREGGDYVPVVESSFWLEWHAWAKNPLGYHLDNLLLHILSALLIWRILARLKIPGARLAAAIFALHPVNVESVAWIAERKNTLSMFLYLGALLSYLKFEDLGKRRWYGLALVLFSAALLSKTAIAPLPVALLLMAWWRRGQVERRDGLRSLPFFALAIGGGLLGAWLQRGMGGHDYAASFGSRVAGAGYAFWFYLGKAIFPFHLAPVYARWHIDSSRWVCYVPAAAVAAVFGVAWACRKKWGRPVLASMGYFLALIAPALGFVAIGSMFWLVADHWQYFAIIGPIALAAGYLTVVAKMPVAARAIVCALALGGLGALTWRQARVFQNPPALWAATLAADPDSFVARSSIGAILFREGKTQEAIGELKKSIAIEPAYVDAHYDLGNIYLQTGRPAAAAEYQEVLRLSPAHFFALNNLAWIKATCPEASLRDGHQAVELAKRARQLADSADASIYGTLAAACAEAGMFPQAVENAHKGLELSAAAHDAAQTSDLRSQLQFYERGTPYRDLTMTPK